MRKCFVMQPFDSAGFDKRYDDILVPAIEAAGLVPYRVDRDPSVVVPIEEVEKGIASSHAAVADISLDNANIWYEVGFAHAAKVPLVLICSSDRKAFPFDIQHRTIIVYERESASDFVALKRDITARLTAVVAKKEEQLTNEIRRSRMIELASVVLWTPHYDVSLVEEILMEIRASRRVSAGRIGDRREITAATVEDILDRMVREKLVSRSGRNLKLTDLGEEMSRVLSEYLRPHGLEVSPTRGST